MTKSEFAAVRRSARVLIRPAWALYRRATLAYLSDESLSDSDFLRIMQTRPGMRLSWSATPFQLTVAALEHYHGMLADYAAELGCDLCTAADTLNHRPLDITRF